MPTEGCNGPMVKRQACSKGPIDSLPGELHAMDEVRGVTDKRTVKRRKCACQRGGSHRSPRNLQ